MKGLIVLRVGVAIAGILMGGAAFAQDPGPPGPGGPPPGMGHRPPFERAFGGHEGKWWNNPKMVEQLKLTDDQRKAFDDILQQHRASLIDLRANLEKSELALEPLISSDQPNENAIVEQIDKVAQARAELEKANARYLLALRSKLTPDQWKQMQQIRSERSQQMRDRWGAYGRRGPNGPSGAPSNAPPPPSVPQFDGVPPVPPGGTGLDQ
jgi:Spy/CpxP family protein refolding chaperone